MASCSSRAQQLCKPLVRRDRFCLAFESRTSTHSLFANENISTKPRISMTKLDYFVQLVEKTAVAAEINYFFEQRVNRRLHSFFHYSSLTPSQKFLPQRKTRAFAISSAKKLDSDSRKPVKAAFFDVDGTIVKSNIVVQYIKVRMAELSPLLGTLWLLFFAFKIPLYLLLDRIDRAVFSRTFYRNYSGRLVTTKESMASVVYEAYMRPKLFTGALQHIRSLKDAGFKIVLVTGSLDFLMVPLATDLGVDHVFAARLKEKNGRFTGELEGNGMSRQEKAALVRSYAEEFGISLKESHAYGDSIADLSMLEEVGHPFAVRPDQQLRSVATERGWEVVDWSVDGLPIVVSQMEA